MNPADMRELGIEDGAPVDVESDFGRMEQVLAREFDLPSGDVMAYYPEANALIGTSVDPRSRTPSFKSTRVDIHPNRANSK